MSQAAVHRLYVPESAHVARTLLRELRQAHRNLISQMAAMDAVTAGEAFDPLLCVHARWRLSQASLARRLLAARICDYFLHRLDADEREQMKALAEADQALLRESSRYIGRWSAATLASDWPAFCDASREMRGKMHAHVVLEQKLLYPMLDGAARRA